MAAMYRYLICALFATLISAQTTTTTTTANSTDILSSALASVSSIVSSVTSVIGDVTSVIDSATSALETETVESVISSLTSVIESASSVASSASSVASSASSVESSISESITSTTTTPPPTTTTTPPPSSTTEPSSTIESTTPPSSTTESTSVSISTTSLVTTSSSISSSSQTTPSPTTTTSPEPSITSSEGESSTSESESESESPTFVYTSSSASVSYQETVYSTEAVVITTQPDGSTQSRTQQTVIATVVPATTVFATTVVTSTESPTGIAGLQAEGLSSSSNGLSTGAKAGIGAGVGVLVVGAAIIGALYAMRRRKRNRIADEDRYTPSYGPSLIGGGFGKTRSRYSESEVQGQMREANPLDRYTTGVSNSQRTSIPNHSRTGATSDISSVSGVGSEQYRPGPGMPVVVEQSSHAYTPMAGVNELPSPEEHRPQYDYAAAATGNPFVQDNDRTSMYSDDDQVIQPRTTSPAALELSGENNMNRHPSAGSGGGPGGAGYRGMDPEQPYHTRAQLQKPSARPGHVNPSQNF